MGLVGILVSCLVFPFLISAFSLSSLAARHPMHNSIANPSDLTTGGDFVHLRTATFCVGETWGRRTARVLEFQVLHGFVEEDVCRESTAERLSKVSARLHTNKSEES